MSKLVSRSISRVNALLIAVFVVVTSSAALADTYQFGQHIEPAYEGWRPNADGTFSFMFGYMNENWTEQPDVLLETIIFSPPAMPTEDSQPTSCPAETASPLRL